MKTPFLSISSLSLLFLVVVSGCKKQEKYDTTAAEDNALAEAAFSDVFNQVDKAAREDSSVYRLHSPLDVQSGCASVTVTPSGNSWPKTIVLDFGTTNCTGADQKERRGKIYITMSDRYHNVGTVTTITPQDYYVNDIKVEGTKTVTNNGLNSAGNMTWSIDVSNAKITSGSKVITWNSTRTREWVQGAATPFNIFDDVYEITGSANGVSSGGDSFTVQITKALQVNIGCRWITKGAFDLTVANLPVRNVDYGSGTCDNQATLTINNKTYNITLK